MKTGENVIPFRGSVRDQGIHAASDHPDAPWSAAGEPNFFIPLGDAALPVILRLKGKLLRVSVRARVGDKPAPSQT